MKWAWVTRDPLGIAREHCLGNVAMLATGEAPAVCMDERRWRSHMSCGSSAG
ncbi:MAG: hypothetical protein R3E87_19855 [Burkholderiaceae bacterium]